MQHAGDARDNLPRPTGRGSIDACAGAPMRIGGPDLPRPTGRGSIDAVR